MNKQTCEMVGIVVGLGAAVVAGLVVGAGLKALPLPLRIAGLLALSLPIEEKPYIETLGDAVADKVGGAVTAFLLDGEADGSEEPTVDVDVMDAQVQAAVKARVDGQWSFPLGSA